MTPNTNIEEANRSRKILAFVETDIYKGYQVLDYNKAFDYWVCDKGFCFYDNQIKAWAYVFDPPEKKSELRKKLDFVDRASEEVKNWEHYLVICAIHNLLENLVEEIERLKDG